MTWREKDKQEKEKSMTYDAEWLNYFPRISQVMCDVTQQDEIRRQCGAADIRLTVVT